MMIELAIFFCTATSVVVVVVVKRFFMSFLSGAGLDFQVSHTHTSRHTEAAHKTGKCYTNTRATFPQTTNICAHTTDRMCSLFLCGKRTIHRRRQEEKKTRITFKSISLLLSFCLGFVLLFFLSFCSARCCYLAEFLYQLWVCVRALLLLLLLKLKRFHWVASLVVALGVCVAVCEERVCAIWVV